MQESLLLDIFFYFCATVVCVPIFKAMGLGSIFGYLVSGLLLGPHGLSLLSHANNIHEISEIGLIMLLFVIGLELSPARLKHLKNMIVGVGVTQFTITTGIFYLALGTFELGIIGRLLIASSLSLSSTAFALTYLRDSDQLTKSYGQSSFAALIFQDLIILPLMAAIPLLAGSSTEMAVMDTKTFMLNLGFVAASLIVGKFALRPALHKIYQTQSNEIFTGSCLMIILGAALLMEHIGLSKAIGAFLAGVFLSGSDFRSEIQSFSIPLKSMLMGVFFMGFGLEFDVNFFKANLNSVLLLTFGFMAMKFLILLVIGGVVHKEWKPSLRLGLILCQGGEFGFLIVGQALSYSLLPMEAANYALCIITISIFSAPFLTKMLDIFLPAPTAAIVPEVDAKILPFPENEEEEKVEEDIPVEIEAGVDVENEIEEEIETVVNEAVEPISPDEEPAA